MTFCRDKELFFNIVIIVLSSLLTVFVGEFFLRAFPGVLPDSVQLEIERREASPIVFDSNSWRRVLPNFNASVPVVKSLIPNHQMHVKTISITDPNVGFRDDGINHEFVAIALGDSFTFGSGVSNPDIWTEVLERRANIDVVNMGVAGASNIEGFQLLKEHGVKIKPQLIIWAFFPGNDFIDNVNFLRWKGRRFAFIRNVLSQHSRVYLVVNILLKQFRNKNNNGGDFVGAKVKPPATKPSREPFANENINKGVLVAQDLVLQAIKLSKIINAKLVILVFHSKGSESSVDIATIKFKNFLKINDVSFIRIWPELDDVKIPGDGHWNEKGHRLVAEELLRYLKSNNFIL